MKLTLRRWFGREGYSTGDGQSANNIKKEEHAMGNVYQATAKQYQHLQVTSKGQKERSVASEKVRREKKL